MESLLQLVDNANGFLWNVVLIVLLCGTGIFYTIKLKFKMCIRDSLCTFIVSREIRDDECAILFWDIKRDSIKSISAFYTVFPPLQRP